MIARIHPEPESVHVRAGSGRLGCSFAEENARLTVDILHSMGPLTALLPGTYGTA